MQIPVLFAIQIAIFAFIAGNSLHSPAVSSIRHSAKQVLGVTYLAQDATDQTQSQPQDQTSPQDFTSQPAATDQTQQSTPQQSVSQTQDTTQQVQPTSDQTQPTANQSSSQAQTDLQPTSQDISPTSVSEVSPTESFVQTENVISPTPEPTEIPSVEGQLDSQSVAESLANNQPVEVINTNAVSGDLAISSTSEISQNIINTAEKNDSQIDTAQTPETKVNALLSSEQEDLQLFNTSLHDNNYSDASFLTQRLINNIQAIQSTTPLVANRIAVKTQLITFCTDANAQLRTQQFMVPEELEQDIEIARSICQ